MQAGYANFSHMLEPDEVLKEAKTFLEEKFKQQIWIYKEPRKMGGYFYHVLFAKNVFWGFILSIFPTGLKLVGAQKMMSWLTGCKMYCAIILRSILSPSSCFAIRCLRKCLLTSPPVTRRSTNIMRCFTIRVNLFFFKLLLPLRIKWNRNYWDLRKVI